MKTLQIALFAALIAGCASTSDKISGNYAVFIDPALAQPDQIVRALRDRLSSVDVVASPADDSHDALIVLSTAAKTGQFMIQPDTRVYPETPKESVSIQTRRTRQQLELVHFEIVRAGRTASSGDVRVIGGYPTDDLVARQQALSNGSPDQDSARIQQGYGRGIDIAREVVKALKGEG